MGIFFPVNDENETPGEKGICLLLDKNSFYFSWNEFHFQKLITFFQNRIFGFKINSTLKLVFILIFFPFLFSFFFPDKNEKLLSESKRVIIKIHAKRTSRVAKVGAVIIVQHQDFTAVNFTNRNYVKKEEKKDPVVGLSETTLVYYLTLGLEVLLLEAKQDLKVFNLPFLRALRFFLGNIIYTSGYPLVI